VPYPNFFIIGANKAGTTSLHRYLGEHPDVYVSPVKEPSYFALWGRPAAPARDMDAATRHTRAGMTRTEEEYLALFAGVDGEHAIGEASTAYFSNSKVAERIAATVPDAKLIAVLRQPSERAFSAYAMHVSWGVETLSFPDAIAAELADDRVGGLRRHYLPTGFYARHLQRFLAAFPAEQLHVGLYEDLGRDPRTFVRHLFEFLDVDSTFAPDITSRHHVTQAPSRLDRVPRRLRRATHRLIPARARRTVRARTSRPLEFPAATREQLDELYRDDILLTQTLIGRDLSAWLEPPELEPSGLESPGSE
jgi:hypothetical protein